MKVAILISDNYLDAHHCHFVSRLNSCADVVGAISFPRGKNRQMRLLQRHSFRNPLKVCSLVIGHCHNRKVSLARAEAFQADRDILSSLTAVHVSSMQGAAERARQWQVDALFQLGAGIIREPLLSATAGGVLSFHHGIMPLLKGLASPFWAITLNRPDCLGITLQQLNERLDEGAIMAQSTIEVRENDTFADIVLRLDYTGADMIEPTVRLMDTRADCLTPPPGEGIYRSHPNLMDQLMFNRRLRVFCREHCSRSSA